MVLALITLEQVNLPIVIFASFQVTVPHVGVLEIKEDHVADCDYETIQMLENENFLVPTVSISAGNVRSLAVVNFQREDLAID